jgi:hypothetical protein
MDLMEGVVQGGGCCIEKWVGGAQCPAHTDTCGFFMFACGYINEMDWHGSLLCVV